MMRGMAVINVMDEENHYLRSGVAFPDLSREATIASPALLPKQHDPV
jgi:hypothetical protein